MHPANVTATSRTICSPLLSICIPTFNRCDLTVPLVRGILQHCGDLEIRVHDDGSNDETGVMLSRIEDPRLHVTQSTNRGRARALRSAISDARGAFTMIFDDDDTLSEAGLDRIITDCSAKLPKGVIGYIYQMVDENGRQIGSDFPVDRANLLSLRLDWKVRGDKKEVVSTALLQRAVEQADLRYRRVPTSFYWSLLAFEGDVICRNLPVGRKTYRRGGMTYRNRRLKLENAKPMADLYTVQLRAFARGRYRSAGMATRALFAAIWFSIAHLASGLVRARPTAD